MDATTRPSQQLINAQKELARRRRAAGITTPVQNAEFGIRNAEATTDTIKQYSVNSNQSGVQSPDSKVNIPQSELQIPHSAHPASPSFPTPNSELRIRISPTLAAHCLDRQHRHNGASLDGPYRLYKILGALDKNGRGWLANSEVEPLLTKKESPYYIYGRRQLKIILRRGEGLFWQRVKSKGQLRIRLVSRAKLLEGLSPGSRLRGREVEIPLTYLLGSGRGRQADANAALYAAVQAGHLRPDRTPAGRSKPRPISRARLQELAGCSTYRQRSYERRMAITVERNIHILGPHSDYELERARRHHGLPAYKHTDYQGKLNRHRRGFSYIAVRLPNSYHLPDTITVVQSQRQRTINRSLDGLCHMGSGGSDREQITRLYHSDAAAAVRAGENNQQAPAYWPVAQNAHTRLWQTVAGLQSGKMRDEGHSIPHSFNPHSPNPTSHIPHRKGGDLN